MQGHGELCPCIGLGIKTETKSPSAAAGGLCCVVEANA
jgi:hypothetical protein